MSGAAAGRGDEASRSAIESLLDDVTSGELPAWLATRRWFADKGRPIARVELEDTLIEVVEGDWLAVAIARVALSDGGAARYLLPLAVTRSVGDIEAVISAASGPGLGVLIDATETPWFGRWFLDRMTGPADPDRARWVFITNPAAEPDLRDARNVPTTVLRGEQSNTSLRFGEMQILKLFRRLQPGPNPDEEVPRALATAGFSRVPRFSGAAFWRSADGEQYPIAIAQAFVPNNGDGWSWMLHRLAGVAAGQIDPEDDRFAPERLLGRRTGELHVALSQIAEPGFVPEAPDSATIAADVRRTRGAVEQTIMLLQDEEARVPDSFRTRLPQAIEWLKTIAERAEGFRDEAGAHRIRVHGDYHLGQVLRTHDDDWTVIDFEGEPTRPVAERRQKTSALKDVAGMLRSFAYARGAAERVTDAAGQALTPLPATRRAGIRPVEPGEGERAPAARLALWEEGARRAFVEGYRRALRAAPIPLVPRDDDAFRRALAAWELDKGLYEIAYEARHRPDWLELPLRTLLRDVVI